MECVANILVCGVDEAGRGPLAGPVVAAAVVLAPAGRWDGMNDSKLVDRETRELLYARVLTEARAFAWSVTGPRAIDRANIRRASLAAMARAVRLLRVSPELVLVDGVDLIPGIRCDQQSVVDGDARMLSIAAASILAKVVRDAFMARADRRYPAYGFRQHKGYATAAHLEALARLGPCPLHRRSFHGVIPGGAGEPVDPSLELPLF